MAVPAWMSGLGASMGGGAGISKGLQAMSPLLMAMSAGLQSGQGAAAGMPLGLAQMMQMADKRKADQQKADAAKMYGQPISGAPGGFTGRGMMGGIAGAMGAKNQPQGGLQGAMTAPPGFQLGKTPAVSQPLDAMFSEAEQKFQLPPGYLARTAQIESGGNPGAKNPNSSASGLFQFVKGTARQYGVDPMDPVSSTMGAAQLAADNKAILTRALGREPNAGELYLAHQQGGAGAAKLLSNPTMMAKDVVGAEAVRLNGGDANMTTQDFANKWVQKFGMESAPADPMGDPRVKQLLQVLAIDPSHAAARAELEMRVQQIQNAPQQGLSAYEAATLGQRDYETQLENQPQPLSPDDRYKVVGGQLVDLYGANGPEPVIRDQPADPIAALRVRAAEAGLKPGTPEYQQFMVSGGGGGGTSLSVGADGTVQFNQGGSLGVGRPLTEGQSKDNYYLSAVKHAADVDKYESALSGVGGAANAVAGSLPGGGFAQSEAYQVGQVAATEWGAAILRKESGAALTASDQEWLTRRFIPVPGDKPATIARKREARAAAQAGLQSGMSPEQIKAVTNALGEAPEAKTTGEIPQSAVDAGVDPDLWQYMDEGQKALWAN